ncbi:hypothetical protein D3C86_2034170 [compost metagenome]
MRGRWVERHQRHRVEQRHHRVDLGRSRCLFGNQDRVCPGLDAAVGYAPDHQPLLGVAHLAAGQASFCGLDSAAELPALADADDLVFGDLAVYQFV